MFHLFESVDDNIVKALPGLVEQLGGDPSALLQRVGLSLVGFLSGEERPDYRQVIELVGVAAAELNCDHFGMRLAQAQAGTIRSPLVRVIETAGTLGDALRLICEHSYAHSPAVAIWLDEDHWDDTVAYGLDILLDDLPNRSQAMEQVLLIAYRTLQQAMGTMLRAKCITFRHEPISPISLYRRYFGCNVVFGQSADAIILSQSDLDRRILHRSEEDVQAVLAAVQQRLSPQETPVHAKVRGFLMNRMGSERCGVDDAAFAIGCSTKKLARMLVAEGTSFQRVKNKIRMEFVRYYIEETALDFTAISGRVGFSEQSALTHFCSKWLNACPSEMRSAARTRVH